MAEEISKRVLLPHQFDSPGAVQFQYDCWCLFSIFKPYTRKPENLFKRVKESLVLLTLQPRDSSTDFSPLMTGSLASDFRRLLLSPPPSLEHVAQVVFHEEVESAAALLDDMGIYLLTVEEAQAVLLRHVDLEAA